MSHDIRFINVISLKTLIYQNFPKVDLNLNGILCRGNIKLTVEIPSFKMKIKNIFKQDNLSWVSKL